MTGTPDDGKSGQPPLRGIRVVDCSERSPGPYATQILADLGADVVIVERPQAGTGGDQTAQQQLLSLRRGKRSIILDLKQPALRRSTSWPPAAMSSSKAGGLASPIGSERGSTSSGGTIPG